jgi:uncharacterized membrane protein YjgN (DUF898 family)
MSFVGFLRLHQAQLFGNVVAIVLLWFAFGLFVAFLRRNEQAELARFVFTARRYIIAALVAFSAIAIASSYMSNMTPRAVIDRTEVNRQQDQHEQDVQDKQRKAEAERNKEQN